MRAVFEAARADAVSISMDPAASVVGVGDTVSIALNVSGLVDGAAPSLGVYDVNVAWDPSVVSLSFVSIGDPLLGDQLDIAGFGTITTIAFGTGNVNLFELSLDSVADLDANQAGAFTIATLNFQIIPTTRWEEFTLEFLKHQECRGKGHLEEFLGPDAAKGFGCPLAK